MESTRLSRCSWIWSWQLNQFEVPTTLCSSVWPARLDDFWWASNLDLLAGVQSRTSRISFSLVRYTLIYLADVLACELSLQFRGSCRLRYLSYDCEHESWEPSEICWRNSLYSLSGGHPFHMRRNQDVAGRRNRPWTARDPAKAADQLTEILGNPYKPRLQCGLKPKATWGIVKFWHLHSKLLCPMNWFYL